jgi:hypothetical protein
MRNASSTVRPSSSIEDTAFQRGLAASSCPSCQALGGRGTVAVTDHMPLPPIPPAWFELAGAVDFVPTSDAYDALSDPAWSTTIIPAEWASAPRRDAGAMIFDRQRMMRFQVNGR